jgi:hypothetical protein
MDLGTKTVSNVKNKIASLSYYSLCTDSIKPSLQFLCNFAGFIASEGSLFPDIHMLT